MRGALVLSRGRFLRSLPSILLFSLPTFFATNLFLHPVAQASLTYSGDLNPADPTTWTTTTTGKVGNTADGSMTLDSGTTLSTNLLYFGDKAGVNGSATITDAGSRLTTNTLQAGFYGNSTINVQNGATVQTSYGYIASQPGSFSTFNVSGSGSVLNTSNNLQVGAFGQGTLNLTNAAVANIYHLDIGVGNSTTGIVNIDGPNSILTVTDQFLIGAHSTGVLKVTNHGSVVTTSVILGVISGSYGNLTVDGAGSTFTSSGPLKALNSDGGKAAIEVTNGGILNNTYGNVGSVGSIVGSATVLVDGPNSQWNNSNILSVYNANITISHGGKVTNPTATINNSNSSSQGIKVDGPNSRWDSTGTVSLLAPLHITNGGTVTSKSTTLRTNTSFGWTYLGSASIDGAGSTWSSSGITINSGTQFALSNGGQVVATAFTVASSVPSSILVDGGSNLNLGTFNNNGVIRVTAGPQTASGSTWTPISASTWQGTGTINPIGGTWDSASHIFTASTITDTNSNLATTLDRSLVQRLHISVPASTLDLYTAFTPTSISADLTLTATLSEDTQKALLAQIAGTTQILAAWDFTATGYTAGDPVLLSMNLGSGYSTDQLAIWHFDGATWTPYLANDLNSHGNYANFTVTGFSDYAVVLTPEPASLFLLLAVGLPLLARRKKG